MRHIRKDIIERYSLGRLNESGVDRVEVHLLVCEKCRENLDNFEAFAALIKIASATEASQTMSAGQ
jgi:anti-sigma factor ChrR (cupin superfamily)